jgi:hypothetical protein
MITGPKVEPAGSGEQGSTNHDRVGSTSAPAANYADSGHSLIQREPTGRRVSPRSNVFDVHDRALEHGIVLGDSLPDERTTGQRRSRDTGASHTW